MNTNLRRFLMFWLSFCTVVLSAQKPQPVPVEISKHIEKKDGAYYHLHKVEKGQTLYSISRTYQVKVADIQRTIDKPEIQTDEILWIPISAERLKTLDKSKIAEHSDTSSVQHTQQMKDTVTDISMATDTDSLLQKPDSVVQKKIFTNAPKDTLNVALMLPLYLNEVDQSEETRGRRGKKLPKSFSFMSFYEGAKMAAELFDSCDVKINMQIFDVTDDVKTATHLINSGRLENVDMIVGPVFLRSFKTMSDYAKEREIFIINPLSDRDEILLDNPYVMKVNPSNENKLNALINQVIQENEKQHILILFDTAVPQEEKYAEQMRLFFESFADSARMPVFINISKEKGAQIEAHLSDTKSNAIVYLSHNEAVITEILTQISKRDKSPNVLYCLHNLKQFDFTEVLYMNDLQTHYAETFFVNPNAGEVKNFELLFFDTYQTLPDKNAYIGFDVMNYVFQLLKNGNTNYGNLLETSVYKGFHNAFLMRRKDVSQGLENGEVNILKIEHSQLKKVNE